MKNLKYLLVIFTLVFMSCENKKYKIQQHNIDFVESLKKEDDKNHLKSIDSVLSITEQNDELLALLHEKKGGLHSILDEEEGVIRSLNKALPIFEKIGDKEYIAKTYWLLGHTNALLSNNAIANRQLQIALQYSKEINNKIIEADCYRSFSLMHEVLGDFQKSTALLKKSAEICKTINDSVGLSLAYGELAINYEIMGQFEEAIFYTKESLEIYVQQKDKYGISASYNNIGILYEDLNDIDRATIHYLKAVELDEEDGRKSSIPLQNLGQLYLSRGDLKQAENYYSQALIIENEKNYIPTKLELYNELSKIHLQNEDFEKCLLFQQIGDSLNLIQVNMDAQERLDLMEDQYQLEANKRDLKLEQKLNNKNKAIFLIVLGSLTILGLFSFQYTKNRKLKIEKEKIQLEQKVLRSQMNPHFIFNVLSSIQSSLMDSDPIKSAGYLSKFAKLIRQNFDFIDKKTITLAEEKNMLENYIRTQQLRFNDKFDYHINIDESIDSNSTEIPPFLLQPFIENAIEHGFKDGVKKGDIILTVTKENDKICYKIVDNGRGYTTLKPDGSTHSIEVLRKRLKLIGNADEKTLEIESSKNGTIVKFSLTQ